MPDKKTDSITLSNYSITSQLSDYGTKARVECNGRVEWKTLMELV